MLRAHTLVVSSLIALASSLPAAAKERPLPFPPPLPVFDAPSLPAKPPLSPTAEEIAGRLAATEGKLSVADRADRAALTQFYAARNNEPVWLDDGGIAINGRAVVAEIGRAGDWGLDPASFTLPAIDDTSATLTPAARAETDIAISLAVLKYARFARGGRTDPYALSRSMDRKPPLLDPAAVIAAVTETADPDAYLRRLQPQHPQFELLRQKYLEAKRGEPVAAASSADDETSHSKRKRKARAAESGDALARRLLANMEQWRWMPPSLGEFYVWVNVPEYTLRVVKDGKVIHTERVVVGKTSTQTPIFSDEMEQVIFHPFWGVPDSIKMKELLPSLARGNTGVLERNGLRIKYRGHDIDPESVDWSTADMRNFHVYQPPGSSNALGIVKFRFPNKHDVYMHDTPSKGLFNASVRAFSHGCMRVRNPLRLAELLLAEDKGWPASRIASAAQSRRQDYQVNLTHKFPVHITYFTAAVDQDGRLKTFPDIYGIEHRVAMGLEGKGHLIAEAPQRTKDDRPTRAQAAAAPRQAPPARMAEQAASPAKKEWIRRVFGN